MQVLFVDHAIPLSLADVRLSALEALVDFTRADGKWEDLVFLLDIAENDPDHMVRHRLLQMLIEKPPFHKSQRHRLDREELVERLWASIK